MQTKRKIVLRIDDINASSKQFEVYGSNHLDFFGKRIPLPFLGDFLFLKHIPPFKLWGPYRELGVHEWEEIFGLLETHRARLTVGITAAWVEKDGSLIPFNHKFPDEAGVLKRGMEAGFVEIANHGLTHCVVGNHLPRLFSSNRKYHREFWDWIPGEVHREHIKKSQQILESYFETKVTTFIPPGNVFTLTTIKACSDNGIMFVNCNTMSGVQDGVRIISNQHVIAFHDREIVLYGIQWFRELLEKTKDFETVWVREIADID